MTKISTYPIDTDVTGADKWIGTDSDTYNQTKNFTPVKLAKYFNNSEIISIGTNLRYVYDILEVGEERKYGTITFDPQQGSNVPFSSISTFILSKFTIGGKNVEQYIQKLEGSQIVICNSDNPNSFGVFDITSVTQIILEPNFYTVVLEFVDGYGNLVEDKSYAFQLIRFGQDAPSGVTSVTGNIVDNTDPLNPIVTQVQSDWNAVSGLGAILNKPTIPTKTSDLTNDGEDGVNPFITAADVPTSDLQGVLESGSYAIFLNESNENVEYNFPFQDIGGNYITTFSHSDNVNGLQGVFSMDTSGVYASSSILYDDKMNMIQLSCPPAQSVAETYNNFLNLSCVDYITSDEGFYSVLAPTPDFNEDVLIKFPIKPTGDYTLATTDDIPAVTGYVPYTGATQNVDLGEYELKAGQMTLDVSPTGTAAVGTTRWNNTIGSSETTLKGGSVILKNGVDLVARVVNKVTPNTTLTKATYPAVRVTGAQGQRLAVAYAQANNDNNSADTIGIVCETIATNQEGFILTVGQLEEINTTGSLQGETWADGDVIYLSPTTAGSLTNVKPNGSTGHIVVIGYVEYAHAIHGSLYVKVMNGWELDELHNVYITSPTNNQVLAYNSTSQLWENESVKTLDGLSLMANADLSYFNQWSFEQNFGYITPNVGNTTYTGIRTTNSNSQTGQTAEFGYPARMLYASATTLGAFATQRGTVGGNFIPNINLKMYWKRRFQIDCNISGSRFVCGLSNMFQLAVPTNVEPDTLINTIGVCKLSTSNNLHFFWNDATGLATTVDLGVDYPANNVTSYRYDLEIYKESGTANITLKLTRIDASGNRISTTQLITSNINNGVTHSPVIYGTNNATASSFRFYDYGIIFKHYNLGWDTI